MQLYQIYAHSAFKRTTTKVAKHMPPNKIWLSSRISRFFTLSSLLRNITFALYRTQNKSCHYSLFPVATPVYEALLLARHVSRLTKFGQKCKHPIHAHSKHQHAFPMLSQVALLTKFYRLTSSPNRNRGVEGESPGHLTALQRMHFACHPVSTGDRSCVHSAFCICAFEHGTMPLDIRIHIGRSTGGAGNPPVVNGLMVFECSTWGSASSCISPQRATGEMRCI